MAEFEAAMDRSDAARDIFETAFGITETSPGGIRKGSPCLDLERMKDKTEGARDMVLVQLRQWACALQWPTEMENGHWEAKADTVEQVAELLRPFTDRGLWVFIKVTR